MGSTPARLDLLVADLPLLDAAARGDEALGRALGGCQVARDWQGFPGAVPRLREAIATDPGRTRWGRLADLAGVFVQRTARSDSTALGAATLAGLAARVWDGREALPEVPLDLVAEPELAPADRTRERERWAAARELTAGPDAWWRGGR